MVDPARACRMALEELRARPHITGEQETHELVAPPGRRHFDLDGDRTEKVTSVPETRAKSFSDAGPSSARHEAELLQAGRGIPSRIDGQDRGVATARGTPIELFDLHLLDVT